MTTNKYFDKKQNISKEAAERIQSTFLTLTQPAITKVYEDFCISESIMAKAMNTTIDAYTKLVINNTMIGTPEMEKEMEDMGMPLDLDPVEDALNISHAYKSIANILKNIYLMGIYSGKAMTDTEFESNFNLGLVTEEEKEEKERDIQKVENIDHLALDSSKLTAAQMEILIKKLFEGLGLDVDVRNETSEDDKE